MSLTIALNLSRFSPKPFKPVSRVKLFFWFSHWSRLSHLKSNLNQVLIVGDIHNYSFLFLLCFNYCRNKTKLLFLLQSIQYSEIDSGCMWHLSDEGLLGSSSICWTSLFLENNLWRMWRLKTANDFGHDCFIYFIKILKYREDVEFLKSEKRGILERLYRGLSVPYLKRKWYDHPLYSLNETNRSLIISSCIIYDCSQIFTSF